MRKLSFIRTAIILVSLCIAQADQDHRFSLDKEMSAETEREENMELYLTYSKTCLKRPLKKVTIIVFEDRLTLNAGQKYCRMLQWEHFAILSTFIKLPFVVKTFILSILQVLLYI